MGRRHDHHLLIFGVVAVVLMTAPSVAVASHLFADVADTSPHAPGIGYVAERGITQGCDERNYCPGDALTRAQMGTFLFRSSGSDPATPPSVNAERLQGMAPSDFRLAEEPVDAATLGGRTPGEIASGGHHWAYVIADGGLHASSGAVTVHHPNVGEYCVVIPREPAHKAAQATLADPGGSKSVAVRTGHGSACNPSMTATEDVVPVTIRTTTAVPIDRNFTIIIPRSTVPTG